MDSWYKVEVHRAHFGSGKDQRTIAYMFVKDPMEALIRYKTMPGVKRDKIPNILPVSDRKSKEVEENIIQEKRISLNVAKKTWYYSKRI